MSGILVAGKYKRLDPTVKTLTIPKWAVEWMQGQGGNEAFFTDSPWANRCITIRMNTLAGIPWEIVRPTQGEDGIEYVAVEDSHPAVILLKDVNPEYDWIHLARGTVGDKLIYGKAFWWKGKERIPKHLVRLHPNNIKVDASSKDGVIKFINQNNNKEYPREEIVFFHDYSPLGDFEGVSAVEAAKEAISVELNADKYVTAFFENYAMPPVLLSMRGSTGIVSPKEQRRFEQTWKRLFGGVNKQHKAALVPDIEANIIGYPLKDLALKEIREEARRSICAIFGVPPAVAGAWEAANYATADEQRKSLYTETVIPEAESIASVINSEIMRLHYGDGLMFRWKYDELKVLQEDESERTKRAVWLVDGKIIKPEVAAKELGYKEEDVPEPMPIPDFTPKDDKEEEDKFPPEPTKAVSDLRAFRRKVLKRLKAGKSAACSFESEHIPDTQLEAVHGALEEITEVSEVDKLFDELEIWGDYP